MQVEEAEEEFDIDLELDDLDLEFENESNSVDFESKEITVIKPFKPGEGFVREDVYNRISDNSQYSLTVKHRPECPCGHVVAEADGRNQLLGGCTECGQYVCDRCETICSACEEPMCPDCTDGHGLKDETYCAECLQDVDEDVEFDRELELREHDHKEEMDELEHELKEEKQEKKLELQEAKHQRQQIRQDWKVVIQLLNTLKNGSSDKDREKKSSDLFGEGSGFEGSGAFTEGKEFTNSSGDDGPGWFEDEFDHELEG